MALHSFVISDFFLRYITQIINNCVKTSFYRNRFSSNRYQEEENGKSFISI